MSFGIPVRNGLSVSLVSSTFLSSGRRLNPALNLDFLTGGPLDPRITFSRTSQATLVDSTGKLTYAPNNLLTNSETFEAAAWVKNNATVTANSAASPTGAIDADLVIPNTTGGVAHNIYASIAVGATPYSLSFYAKQAGYTGARVADTGTGVGARFDLVNGVVFGTPSAGVTASIQSVGNGWYRCGITFTPTAGTQLYGVYVEQTPGTTVYAGNGTSGVLLWGAQLEQVTYQTTPGTYNSTSPKNLLGYTQEFDNAAWTKSNAFVQTNVTPYSEAFDNANWTRGGVNVTANSTAAPNGVQSADTITPDLASSSHRIYVANSLNSTAATFSCYVKANGYSKVGLRESFTTGAGAAFDLSNGTVIGAYNTGGSTVSNMTITDVGSGWYRISCTISFAAATNMAFGLHVLSPSYVAGGDLMGIWAGNATSGIYAWGAQLVQGSTAGDYQRTDAAAAAVQYVAPDGSRTADKLVEAATTGAHYINQNVGTVGTPETFSFYAKAAERGWALAQMGNNGLAYYNLASGTLGTVSSATASITAVGNGWYRCSITATRSSNQNNIIYPATANGTASYTGDGTSGIYIWGSQVSNSASLDPYVYNPVAAPTSAAYYGPRFDYDPVTLANKGLLIEEQRTNLLTYSNDWSNAAWSKTNITVTAASTVSPDGSVNAQKLAATAAASTSITQGAVVAATSATYTIYVKQGTGATTANTFGIRNTTSATNLVFFTFNYTTGAIAYSVGTTGASATAVGNGWWRIQISATTGITSGDSIIVYVGWTGGGAAAGDFLYAYGAQLEAGSFATSYIPTVASQVTRTADAASMQGANFSNWYNPNGGTIVVSASQPTIFASSRSTTSISLPSANVPRITTYRQSAGGVNFYAVNSAIAGNGINSGVTATAGVIHKTAASYNATSQQTLSVNGSAVAVMNIDMTSDLGRLNSLSIGSDFIGSTNSIWCGHIQGIAYYPTALANAQLQSLTAQSTIPSLSLDFTTQVFNVG